MRKTIRESAESIASLIHDAGGTLIGRVRLQKIAFLLELAGEGSGDFYFDYHYYGPYSEDVSQATEMAKALGMISEETRPASWGGQYSVYQERQSHRDPARPASAIRQAIIGLTKEVNAVELELTATAAFFAATGVANPWEEVKTRKPDKAAGEKMGAAKELYRKLHAVSSNIPPIPA